MEGISLVVTLVVDARVFLISRFANSTAPLACEFCSAVVSTGSLTKSRLLCTQEDFSDQIRWNAKSVGSGR